jgi:hypothetical protein
MRYPMQDFEGGVNALPSFLEAAPANTSGSSISIVANPVTSGGYAVRHSIGGSTGSDLPFQRAEVIPKSHTQDFSFQEMMWTWNRIYFPSGSPISTTHGRVIQQFKDLGSQSTTPPMSIHQEGGVALLHSVNGRNHTGAVDRTICPVATGKVYDFVCQAYLDVLNKGWISVWVAVDGGSFTQYIDKWFGGPNAAGLWYPSGQDVSRFQWGIYESGLIAPNSRHTFRAGADTTSTGIGFSSTPSSVPSKPVNVKAVVGYY